MTSEWVNMDEIVNWIDDINQRCQQAAPAFRDSRQVISNSIAQNFAQEGRPNQWARRVSDAAGNFKYPDKLTHPVLNKTGALLASAVAGDDEYNLTMNAQESIMEHGTSVPYVIYHESDAPRTRLAQRSFMRYQEQDIDDIADIFLEFLAPN